MSKKLVAVCLGALFLLGLAITAWAEKAIYVQWVCSYCGSRISSVRMRAVGLAIEIPTVRLIHGQLSVIINKHKKSGQGNML